MSPSHLAERESLHQKGKILLRGTITYLHKEAQLAQHTTVCTAYHSLHSLCRMHSTPQLAQLSMAPTKQTHIEINRSDCMSQPCIALNMITQYHGYHGTA